MTNEATHTPAPWREYDRNDQGDFYLCGEDGLAVAIVLQAVIPRIEGRTEANARLIAAAPELLQAVLGYVLIDEEHGEVYAQAIEAIDKATGAQS